MPPGFDSQGNAMGGTPIGTPGNQPETAADGALVTVGTEADAAYAGSGSTTLIGALKGLYAAMVAATIAAATGIVHTAAQTYANNATPTMNFGQGGELLVTIGGRLTAVVAAASAANTVIKATAGRLCRATVTTAGTDGSPVLIYDNATTNSGRLIGVIPGTVAVGVTYDFQMPAANGVTVANVAAGPGLTISYE